MKDLDQWVEVNSLGELFFKKGFFTIRWHCQTSFIEPGLRHTVSTDSTYEFSMTNIAL